MLGVDCRDDLPAVGVERGLDVVVHQVQRELVDAERLHLPKLVDVVVDVAEHAEPVDDGIGDEVGGRVAGLASPPVPMIGRMSFSAVHHSAVAALLDEVDWDFGHVRSTEPLHDLHPYPARFIPDIPRALIRLFPPSPGLAILDPFCGSGTTLVEAVRAGHSAVGIDLNPIATLISRGKTTALDCDIGALASGIAEEARHAGEPHVPEIPRLDHWFKPDVQKAVAGLVPLLATAPNDSSRDALRLSLSRILVRVSNQESDTRYAAIEKSVERDDVFRLFVESARWVNSVLHAEYGGLFPPQATARVLEGDILDVAADRIGRVGLIITSPPYPNAYEYWLYHKYRMYWLGGDPIEVRRREIGARPHFHGSNPQTEHDFFQQMDQCFELFANVAARGTKVCVVVGRSVIQGREIDNARIVAAAGAEHEFVLLGTAERSIPTTRKAFNPRHGRINREQILVFQRAE